MEAPLRPRRWRWALRGTGLGLIAALVVLLAWGLLATSRSQGLATAVAAGKAPAAPDFTLPLLAGGGTLRLSSLRGKVVMLNFWASWCVPCRQEAPRLAAAWRRWRGHRVVFLGVNAQDFRSDASGFMRKYGLGYPSVHDGPGNTVAAYGVKGFPETWFVSRDGRLVVEHVNGPLTPQQIDRYLTLALVRR